MGRRTILLLTSLLIAAVGTALVALYVRGANDRAVASVDAVEVLVATTQLQAGTPVSKVIPNSDGAPVFDREVVRSQALRSTAELGQLGNQVLKTTVYPGQLIDKRMFQPAGDASASATSQVTKGHVMISVQMSDAERVAAYIQPQSLITVFITRGVPPNRSTDVLLKQAKVLAVGNPVVTESASGSARAGAGAEGESLPTTIVTLDVPQEAAQRLTHARTAGQMSFALINKDSVIDEDLKINDNNLVPTP